MNTLADWLWWLLALYFILIYLGSSSSAATEVAKTHELLQSGPITQQEFDSLKANALR